MKKFKFVILIVFAVVLIAIIGILMGLAIYSVSYNKQAKNPMLTINIEQYGKIDIELYPEYAPNTVSAIIKLAQNGYYDGKVFYAVNDVSIHAGRVLSIAEEQTTTQNTVDDVPTVFDLDSSVRSGSNDDYKISFKGEFAANGYENNTLRMEKGVVALSRNITLQYFGATEESYNSGNSKFFILTEESSGLNGSYAAFGKVVKGLDVVEKIKNIKTIENDSTEMDSRYFESCPVIKDVKVETYGIDYGMPEYIDFDDIAYMSELIQEQYGLE